MTAERVIVREERPGDGTAVRAVNQSAFDSDAEADLVERLRADGDVLIALVADVDGEIAGHILFSRLPIETERGTILAAALAPLAVLREHQRQGIGATLVRRGLDIARGRGVPAVIVLGDPAYYSRFGFRAATAQRLQTPWSGPNLMAIELIPFALGDGHGTARYPAAFTAVPPEAIPDDQ